MREELAVTNDKYKENVNKEGIIYTRENKILYRKENHSIPHSICRLRILI